MADTKISALTTLVAGDIQHTSDVVAIVDTSVTTTKKATAQAVVNAVLAQNTDTTVTGTINQTTIPTSKTLLVSTDIGSTVQGYDAQLADVAGLAVTDGNFIVGNGTNFVAESGSTARTSLGLGTGDSPEFTAVNIGNATDTTVTRVSAGVIAVEGSNVLLASNIGTTVQAYDAQLADVAGLTPTDNGVIIGNGANFVVESGATLKTSLGLTIGTDVQAYDADTAKLDVAQTFTADQTFNNPTVFSAGTASLPSITFTGDTNTGIFSPAADTIAFAEGGAEAMRLDSSGNLGLGVTPSAWSVSGALQSQNSGSYFFGGGTSWSSGNFAFLGNNGYYSGANWLYSRTNAASQYAQVNGEHRWLNAASGTAGNTISFTQAMTLDASGNLGIGETSPATYGKVVIKNDTASGVGSGSASCLWFLNANTTANNASTIFFGDNASSAAGAINFINTDHTNEYGAISFDTRGSGGYGERARIDSSGYFYVTNMAVGGTANLHWSSSAGQFFVTSSSRRFKHDITDYDKGLAEVMQMQPKYFVYNEEPSQKQRVGFIAEDFHDLGMTEFVEYWKDENDQDTPSEIGYSNMVAILVKSIQELKAINDAQATRIETLETRLTALENK